jgi:heterodisulfide reductase subunit C
MKALSHWLELKGHTETSPSMHFDEEFTEQIIATGRIEEGRILRGFFKRTGQSLMQDWLIEFVKRLVRHLPVKLLFMMGMANVLRPRTRGWGGASAAMEEYVSERKVADRRALGLEDEENSG